MKLNRDTDLSKYLIVGGISIGVLLIITVVLFSLLGTFRQGNKTRPNTEDILPEAFGSTLEETFTTAVFMTSDTVNKKITVCDVLTGEQTTFDYSGGTDITDKYGQLITVSQLVKGQIVKLNYITNTKRLTKLSISRDIWENIGITDIKINKEAKIISYLGKNYSYSDATVVISNGKIIAVEDLMSLDYLTIRGWEENIYSIVVTAGHGYLELTGQEQFIGGSIYVGTELVEQITEDMRLIVREGTFTITVSNKKTEGSKEVIIERDKTTVCDVNEFSLEPSKEGTILFQISPQGAVLMIDKVETSYITPVGLMVGEHEIEVSLGGYITYKGKLNVSEGTTNVTIALKEKDGTGGTSDDDSDTNLGGDGDIDYSDDNSQDYNDNWQDNENNDNTSDDNSDDIIYEEEDEIPSGTDKSRTITIKWTTGAEVFFNGEDVGTIKNGELTVPKQYGEISVDLVIDGEEAVTYNIIIENDGDDVVLDFPE